MIKIDRVNKIPKNYRLSPDVIRQIEKMAYEGRVSETYIVESAINEAWFRFVDQEKKQRILNL